MKRWTGGKEADILQLLCIPVAMPSNRESTLMGFLFSAATGGYSLAGSWRVNNDRKDILFDIQPAST